MRSDALALVVALAACSHSVEEAVITTPPARVPERVATGVPHGGFVQTIATTEQADAALTLDNLGDLRLWPSLDGKRPPVPVAATGISELALGHAGEDLLAALLDQAGTVQLLRLGRDGRVHARVQLPGEVRIAQVVAFDGGVLVERADQSIERYDAAGKPRGRLLAEPGETLGAISVRHGSAGVLVQAAEVPVDPDAGEGKMVRQQPVPVPAGVTPPPIAEKMRWIVLGDELRWGTSIKLPEAIDARMLALAPGHRRIAVMHAHQGVLQVFDIDPLPALVPGATPGLTATGTIGFTDDDHVAVVTTMVSWWHAPDAKTNHDPWDSSTTNQALFGSAAEGGAVGDGLAIIGFGSGLTLATEDAGRYLGWNALGNGAATSTESGFLLVASTTRAVWLDSSLVQQAESDLATMSGPPPQYSVWVDRDHAVIERVHDGKYDIELVDTAHPATKPVRIGTYLGVERLEYDAELKLLAIGTAGQLLRFAIDPARGLATALPPLKTALQVIAVRVLDPARAGGIAAIVTSYDDDGPRLAIYDEPAAGAKQVRASKTLPLRGSLLGVAPTGLYYLRSTEGAPYEISVVRDGKPIAKLPADVGADTITAIVPNHDASRLVLQRASELELVDAGGVSKWRAAIWSVLAVTFSADDRTILVRTSGGLVALDASTGERRASACAFGFGLTAKAPAQMQGTLGVAPVCEDPTR